MSEKDSWNDFDNMMKDYDKDFNKKWHLYDNCRNPRNSFRGMVDCMANRFV
jgi:hypothetical protein